MIKIKGQEYLDAAMKDIDQVNAKVFKGVDSDELLFEEYQPDILGAAGFIELYRKDFLPQAKNEAEVKQYSEGIITQVAQLEHTLEVFSSDCPDHSKPQCQHAREQLRAFLNANLGLFPKITGEGPVAAGETKPEPPHNRLDKS